MGYSAISLGYVEDFARTVFGRLDGLQMLELGDQVVFDRKVRERTGKQYFEHRGMGHVSFDLNGRNGALVVDLGKPNAASDRIGTFDVVTNIGTTEHVEPKANQYPCFANIHAWTRNGGLMIHAVPSTEDLSAERRWADHCSFYYSRRFFERLAYANDYELMDFRNINGLSFACLRKCNDTRFRPMPEEFLDWIHEHRESGGILYPDVNDGNKLSNVRKAWLRAAQSTGPWRTRWGLTRPTLTRLIKREKGSER